MRSETITPPAPAEPKSGTTLQWGAPEIEGQLVPDSIPVGIDPLLGASVGSFHIQRLLGLGGMGSVYLAEHPVIGNKVAIKFLHDSLAQDPDTVWRFYQEARAAHVVGHENIVSIYDLNLLPPKRYYMVMEYLEGETLSQRLQRGRVPTKSALRILIQLCDALQCAHEAGVIHRDLKPDNIFLVERRGQQDFVKLVDFGIAKLREGGGGRSTTRVGMLVGTPEYMSPEQCEGREVDARSDLYALGIIAFRLATGRLPFQTPSVTAMLLAQIQQQPPRPSSIEASVDPRLEQAILKALAKTPEERFQSARAFGAALHAVLEDVRLQQRKEEREERASYDWTEAPTSVQRATPAIGLDAELQVAGQPARKLRARHLSSRAVFLCDDDEPPPMFSRMSVALATRAGPLTLEADVVRHLSKTQARAFGSEAGFAVQFAPATPEATRELEALIASLEPQRDEAAEALLERYRTQATHYQLLDLPWDVEFADVGSRGGCVLRDLEALRARNLSPAQTAETEGTLVRVAAAVAILSSMEKRIAYDGELGNFPGVARAVAAGLPALRLDEARARFRGAHPDVDQRVDVHLCRIRLAQALGNSEAMTREYEQALRLDPLNRALHDAYAKARFRS